MTKSSEDELIKTKSDDDEGISKWVWIGLGAVVIGAVARGGDSGSSTARLTINTAELGN